MDQLPAARAGLPLSNHLLLWPWPLCHGRAVEDSSVDSGGAGVGAGALWSSWGCTQPSPLRLSLLEGDKAAGPQSPPNTSPILWTPCALRDPLQGSQSKNLLAFFVLLCESPLSTRLGHREGVASEVGYCSSTLTLQHWSLRAFSLLLAPHQGLPAWSSPQEMQGGRVCG